MERRRSKGEAKKRKGGEENYLVNSINCLDYQRGKERRRRKGKEVKERKEGKERKRRNGKVAM